MYNCIQQDDNVFKSASKDSNPSFSLAPSWTPDTSSDAPRSAKTRENQTEETLYNVHLNSIPELEPTKPSTPPKTGSKMTFPEKVELFEEKMPVTSQI